MSMHTRKNDQLAISNAKLVGNADGCLCPTTPLPWIPGQARNDSIIVEQYATPIVVRNYTLYILH